MSVPALGGSGRLPAPAQITPRPSQAEASSTSGGDDGSRDRTVGAGASASSSATAQSSYAQALSAAQSGAPGSRGASAQASDVGSPPTVPATQVRPDERYLAYQLMRAGQATDVVDAPERRAPVPAPAKAYGPSESSAPARLDLLT